MRNTQLTAVLRAAQETPWAILPEKLLQIRAVLEARIRGGDLEARVLEGREVPQPQRVGSVSVIPVYGTIGPRMNMMTEFSGGTSVDMLTAQLRKAAEDREVSTILLDIDSPGGSVDGVPEVAEEIRRIRGGKRVVASVNAMAASAAYWIGAQASEIAVTPSGSVGSIGVFAMHEDWSEFDRNAGVKTTLIHAGKYKVEGNPFEPLSEDARAHIQAQVDEYREMFIEAVAAGRNMTPYRVRKEFGDYSEGRMALARKAKELGMVDRIESRDMTLSRLLRRGGSGTARASIETERDFEAFLRDEGFSRTEAKSIASAAKSHMSDLRDAGDDDRQRDAGITQTDNPPFDSSLRDAGARFDNILVGGSNGTRNGSDRAG